MLSIPSFWKKSVSPESSWRDTLKCVAKQVLRQLQAYQAAPEYYKLDQWLSVWDAALPNMVKYVLGVDPARVQVWMNLESDASPMQGLDVQPKLRN